MNRDIDHMLASGLAALDAEDLFDAERWFRQIVALQPRHHQAWNALAWTQLKSGQPEMAVEYARQAHALSRRNADYLNSLGVAYGELGELAAAETTLRKALKHKPDFVDALVNLGKVLEKREQLAEAVKVCERARAIDPGFPKLATGLAKMHQQLGQAARAKSVLETAQRGVDAQDLAMGLAECDFELEGAAGAIERLRSAVRQHPDWLLARDSLAHLLLATGQWREGWRLYRDQMLDPLEKDLHGKKILLRGEQGIGDVLFFLRFAAQLRARGAAITLACEKKLLSILSAGTLLEAVREARTDDDSAGGFDFRLRIGDLPLVLDCEETPAAWPCAVGRHESTLARQRLEAFGPGPYLGVTWRAGTDLARRREFGADPSALMKAIAPALVGAAVRGWPGTLVLLQRGARPGDSAEFGAAFQGRFHDVSELGEDLPALLGVLALLDEYVTVSNANVHLLAGLGKTARVLVPYPGEWRWMRREGASPWFPRFPVYRQPQSRDWTEPLARLRADLFA